VDTNSNLIDVIVEGIQKKKGYDIVCIDLTKVGYAITDHFVVCHGESSTQVAAIMESVEEEVEKETGMRIRHREGTENAEWILLDYGVDAVVHIFQKEAREFYTIEDLWADGQVTRIAAE
jgi:ribosome-associated protein